MNTLRLYCFATLLGVSWFLAVETPFDVTSVVVNLFGQLIRFMTKSLVCSVFPFFLDFGLLCLT